MDINNKHIDEHINHQRAVDNFMHMDEENAMDIVDEFDENVPELIFETEKKEDRKSMVSKDSQYMSDCSEEFYEAREKDISISQVRALNMETKHCSIYCFYKTEETYGTGTYIACAECMIGVAIMDADKRCVVREHLTNTVLQLTANIALIAEDQFSS
ncbi:uncharacterized protein LOC118647000 [Monomorium pharaonis]|uniref:uncharacterized protein LOC118647000 n=1 Tax=Monomorium pharaonis TaxID=307658 RepID=UPI001746F13E|nr:uncharacterized protein LOC118647000 [Monomorium pharaonis]